MELPVLVEFAYVLVLLTVFVPFHQALNLASTLIHTFKRILFGRHFFLSLAIKLIALKPTNIMKALGYKLTIVFTICCVVFHIAPVIRPVLHDKKARPIRHPTYKHTNEQRTIGFVHFAELSWPASLQI